MTLESLPSKKAQAIVSNTLHSLTLKQSKDALKQTKIASLKQAAALVLAPPPPAAVMYGPAMAKDDEVCLCFVMCF